MIRKSIYCKNVEDEENLPAEIEEHKTSLNINIRNLG